MCALPPELPTLGTVDGAPRTREGQPSVITGVGVQAPTLSRRPLRYVVVSVEG
jgi:hypothetical protein